MQLGWIDLLGFRSYRTLRYTPSSRLNLLTGPNAQGKTNLLEAVAFLLTGRSFRTSRLSEIPRWGETSTVLFGELIQVFHPGKAFDTDGLVRTRALWR